MRRMMKSVVLAVAVVIAAGEAAAQSPAIRERIESLLVRFFG